MNFRHFSKNYCRKPSQELFQIFLLEIHQGTPEGIRDEIFERIPGRISEEIPVEVSEVFSKVNRKIWQ